MLRASLVALVVLVTVSWSSVSGVEATLRYDFYKYSCPRVESIVYQAMKKAYNKDKTVAPGVLRLIFHDCFVRVCMHEFPFHNQCILAASFSCSAAPAIVSYY